MFAAGTIEWFMLIGIIIIILLVAVFLYATYNFSNKLKNTETVVTDTAKNLNKTADNVNNELAEAGPVLDEIKNFMCTSFLITPKPTFCTPAPAAK